MKRVIIVLMLVVMWSLGFAQQKIKLAPLWQKPEVRLIYREYNLFFTIKDINTTMHYLHEINPQLYDSTSGLDTNIRYSAELVSGRDMEYMNNLQRLLQNCVGAFILLRGHVYIETPDHKKVKAILENAGPVQNAGRESFVNIHFYDAKTHAELFSGKMNVGLQYKYLEL